MEETISIEEIVRLLKRRWVMIISFMFICLGLSAGVTFFLQTPQYSASAQLLIQSEQEDLKLNTDAINTNVLLLDTYKDLIKNPTITTKISERFNAETAYNLTPGQVAGMVGIQQNQKSQLFSLNATTTEPQQAAALANIASDVFLSEVNELNEQVQIVIASRALPNPNPISPNVSVNLALGVILGMVLAVLMTFVLELFNKTVKSPEYISETLGIPILGSVMTLDEQEIKHYKQKQRMILDNPSMLEEFSDYQVHLGLSASSQVSDGLDLDLAPSVRTHGEKEAQHETLTLRSERTANGKRRKR